MDIKYRKLHLDEMVVELFAHFNRYQIVKNCWRKIDGKWHIIENAFVDQWKESEYAFLVDCLCGTMKKGGCIFGAFAGDSLKGFASVEFPLLGAENKYRQLSSIHVSKDMRGFGIGSELFSLACSWAREQGTEMLYISAHSAVETIAFYREMGCVEASEYQQALVEDEPCDCQLEYVL